MLLTNYQYVQDLVECKWATTIYLIHTKMWLINPKSRYKEKTRGGLWIKMDYQYKKRQQLKFS
jgi:hypothetical protein